MSACMVVCHLVKPCPCLTRLMGCVGRGMVFCMTGRCEGGGVKYERGRKKHVRTLLRFPVPSLHFFSIFVLYFWISKQDIESKKCWLKIQKSYWKWQFLTKIRKVTNCYEQLLRVNFTKNYVFSIYFEQLRKVTDRYRKFETVSSKATTCHVSLYLSYFCTYVLTTKCGGGWGHICTPF